MQGFAVLFNCCVFSIVCQFSLSNPGTKVCQRGSAGVVWRNPWEGSCCASRRSEQQLPIPRFLFPPCICQSRPHLPLHSAWFVSVLYQSRWQCLCLRACYWSQLCSGCTLSAHFRAGGFIDGRRAPSRAERVRENEMSPRRSLTGFQHELPVEHMQPLNKPHFLFAACSASQSAPLLQFHSTWREQQPLCFTFFCHFEAWETKVFTYQNNQTKAAEVSQLLLRNWFMGEQRTHSNATLSFRIMLFKLSGKCWVL